MAAQGLDSTTAMHLLQLLRQLSQGGRAIVTTIHQPSSRLYQQLDKLLLLSQVCCCSNLGLLLGSEDPVMTPNSVEFSFLAAPRLLWDLVMTSAVRQASPPLYRDCNLLFAALSET